MAVAGRAAGCDVGGVARATVQPLASIATSIVAAPTLPLPLSKATRLPSAAIQGDRERRAGSRVRARHRVSRPASGSLQTPSAAPTTPGGRRLRRRGHGPRRRPPPDVLSYDARADDSKPGGVAHASTDTGALAHHRHARPARDARGGGAGPEEDARGRPH